MKFVSTMSALATAAAAVTMVVAADDHLQMMDSRGLVADGMAPTGLAPRGLKKHHKKNKKPSKAHGEQSTKAPKSNNKAPHSSKKESLSKRLAFINKLTLPAAPSHGLRSSEGTGYDGNSTRAIDGASVMSFVGDISGQDRYDVLNSVLLAQLAANKAYNREDQTVEWYHMYSEVLENVGWVVPKFTFDKFQASGAKFSMNKVLLKIITDIAGANDMKKAALEGVMEAVEALDGEEGDSKHVFSKEAVKDGKGNFQLGVASSVNGVISLDLGTVRFKSTNTKSKVLWMEFDTSTTDFYNGYEQLTLDDELYGEIRTAVLKKLGKNAKNKIANIEI